MAAHKAWIIETQATEYDDEYVYRVDGYLNTGVVYLSKASAERALAEERARYAKGLLGDAGAFYAFREAIEKDMEALCALCNVDAGLDERERLTALARYANTLEGPLSAEQTAAVIEICGGIQLTEVTVEQ